MSTVATRLAAAGLALPEPPGALGMYVPAARAGLLVFTAGQLPLRDGALVAAGRVGQDVSPEVGLECARVCALNALAAAASVCDLDEVAQVVKLVGYVASTADFTAQPQVIDGASEVLIAAFGEVGRHAREAVGVSALPKAAPVEVSVVLELRP